MSSSLRKPAILIASLDRASAAKLLAQMPKELAARVLAASKALGKINPEEQQAVMQEFLTQKSGKEPPAKGNPASQSEDVELSLSVSAEETEHANSPKAEPSEANSGSAARFAFVTDNDVRPLAAILHREHPRLAALMLAHLPPQRSAAVLSHLEAPLRLAIVERIADIEEASAEVLSELEQELKTQLMRERLKLSGSKQGLATLSGILQASDPQLRDQISAAIESRRRETPKAIAKETPSPPEANAATQIKLMEEDSAELQRTRKDENEPESITSKPVLAFSGLSSLDDISLAAVFGAVTPQTALLALVGADESLVRRILKVLPRKEAAQFRKRLDEVGPLRLKEVEQAQSRLSQAAGELIEQRRISLPIPLRARVAA